MVAKIQWKKWLFLGVCVFVVSLIIMLTALLNDLEKAERQEKLAEEKDTYMTAETKIVMTKDDNDESDILKKGKKLNKPGFPKQQFGNEVNLPKGYIIWKEPSSKLSDPKGPGQGGRPVAISADESSVIQKSYKEYGFNQYVSDKISLHRTIPDVRPIR